MQRTMDARYWEGLGDDYERAIFDSAGGDRSRVVRKRLRAYADPAGVACDFGCGVGHYLPRLARLFRVVYGVDFAESLLRQAGHVAQSFVESASGTVSKSRQRLPSSATPLGCQLGTTRVLRWTDCGTAITLQPRVAR